MQVGWIGLGKLGLPCALAMESRGIPVLGWDSNPSVMAAIHLRKMYYQEDGAQELLDTSVLGVNLRDPARMVAHCDIIFVAVQTPHGPEYEGITTAPEETADFDYQYLRSAVHDLAAEADKQKRKVILVVISTVLPGTMRREVMPLLNEYTSLVYNPFFIAMGTAIRDFLEPEFVLLGSNDHEAGDRVTALYEAIGIGPIQRMSIESAELTKVAYNTFISLKIVFANTLMEICDKIPGANVDDVTYALKGAYRRLISGAYMTAGMGDGGGCHPRDNIAMSHLAEKLGLHADPFIFVTRAREAQAEWLGWKILRAALDNNLGLVLLGKSFKPNTNIQAGSPALLLADKLLNGWGRVFFHYDLDCPMFTEPAVFAVLTRHEAYHELKFPKGSIVVDVWRYLKPQDGVQYIHPGVGV